MTRDLVILTSHRVEARPELLVVKARARFAGRLRGPHIYGLDRENALAEMLAVLDLERHDIDLDDYTETPSPEPVPLALWRTLTETD